MVKTIPLKKAEEVSKNLKLKSISLWESNCRREISFKPKKATVDIEIEVKQLDSTNNEILPFACRFMLTGIDVDEKKESFQLNITFVAAYIIKNGYKPTKTGKEAFGVTNAVFNVWPYVREHIQNTMTKMDLTPILLPPITIGDLSKVNAPG